MEETYALVPYLIIKNGRICPNESHFVDSRADYLEYVEAITKGPQDRGVLRHFPVVGQLQDAFDIGVAGLQRQRNLPQPR